MTENPASTGWSILLFCLWLCGEGEGATGEEKEEAKKHGGQVTVSCSHPRVTSEPSPL
jgi:hypothetical protein